MTQSRILLDELAKKMIRIKQLLTPTPKKIFMLHLGCQACFLIHLINACFLIQEHQYRSFTTSIMMCVIIILYQIMLTKCSNKYGWAEVKKND